MTHQEIVSLCLGQGGNQVGREYWAQLCHEHYIDNTGASLLQPYTNTLYSSSAASAPPAPTSPPPIDNRAVYFASKSVSAGSYAQQTEKFVPRAILFDSEPNVLGKGLATHFCRDLFHLPNIYVHPEQTGAGNNWFMGYDLLATYPQVFNDILDLLQKELESCDNFGGFQLFHSLSGGTGSGFSSAMIELILNDYYPNKKILAMSIFDDIASSTVNVGSYNTILTLARLIEHAHGVIPIDNTFFNQYLVENSYQLDSLFNSLSLPHTSIPGLPNNTSAQRYLQNFNSRNNYQQSYTNHAYEAGNIDSSIKNTNFLLNNIIAQVLLQCTIPLRYNHINNNNILQNNSLIYNNFSLDEFLHTLSSNVAHSIAGDNSNHCHFYVPSTLPCINHRMASFLSHYNFNDEDYNTHRSEIPRQQVNIDAARAAGIALPPSHQQSSANNTINPPKNTYESYVRWLQHQYQYNITISNTLFNHGNSGGQRSSSEHLATYQQTPFYSALPPIPIYHLTLSDAYNSLFNPNNRTFIQKGSTTGKYLNISLFHSINNNPQYHVPTQMSYHIAKSAMLKKHKIAFIGDDFTERHHSADTVMNRRKLCYETDEYDNTSYDGDSYDEIEAYIDQNYYYSAHNQPDYTLSNFVKCTTFIPPHISLTSRILPQLDKYDNNCATGSTDKNKNIPHTNIIAQNIDQIGNTNHSNINNNNPVNVNDSVFNIDTVFMLSNNTSFRHYLAHYIKQFAKMYNNRAYLAKYTEKSIFFDIFKQNIDQNINNNANSNLNTHHKIREKQQRQQFIHHLQKKHGRLNKLLLLPHNNKNINPTNPTIPINPMFEELESSLGIVQDVCNEYHYLEVCDDIGFIHTSQSTTSPHNEPILNNIANLEELLKQNQIKLVHYQQVLNAPFLSNNNTSQNSSIPSKPPKSPTVTQQTIANVDNDHIPNEPPLPQPFLPNTLMNQPIYSHNRENDSIIHPPRQQQLFSSTTQPQPQFDIKPPPTSIIRKETPQQQTLVSTHIEPLASGRYRSPSLTQKLEHHPSTTTHHHVNDETTINEGDRLPPLLRTRLFSTHQLMPQPQLSSSPAPTQDNLIGFPHNNLLFSSPQHTPLRESQTNVRYVSSTKKQRQQIQEVSNNEHI